MTTLPVVGKVDKHGIHRTRDIKPINSIDKFTKHHLYVLHM